MNLKRKPSEKAKPKKPVIKKNVSERNRGQEQLRASEEKFRLLFKAVPVPIFTWQRVDDDFILIDHNDSAKSFTHGTITNFIGIKAKDMYRGNAQILKDLDQCLQSKSTVERDMNYQLISSGEQKYLHVKYAFVPPDLIMYLGDSGTDMETAHGAGMFAVGVLWGYRSQEELAAAGARRLLQHPSELWQ